MATETIGKDFLTDSQRSAVATAQFTVDNAGVSSPQPFTPESLTEDVKPLVIPEALPEKDFGSFAESNLANIEAGIKQTEGQVSDTRGSLLESLQTLGTESARKTELEAQEGLGDQRTELQNVINQLQGLSKEAKAIPLQIQQESIGRGRTTGGVQPLQTARLRENAIKALGLSAIGQTLQGNISLAQQNIQNALDAEFEPERNKLQILQQLYAFNREDLNRLDKKRADALNIALAERERILVLEEADRKEVYNLGLMAKQFGADTATVQDMFKAKTPDEAVLLAGSFLQDPAAQQQLANAKLNNQLTKIRIAKEQEQLALFRLYGGMSPSEYAKSIDADNKSISQAKTESDKQQAIGTSLGKQLTLIDSMLASDGIDTVVGSTFFSRGGQRNDVNFAGRFLKGVGTAISLGTGGAQFDEATGSADDIVNMTEQFISQKFLRSLIDVKAEGATFGALQKAEQDALTAAATKIGAARIRKDGKTEGQVIGYDMSEKDYRDEMAQIRRYTQLAYERATGLSFLPDEQAVFDALDEASSLQFNPTF